jgi:hypothetical protein
MKCFANLESILAGAGTRAVLAAHRACSRSQLGEGEVAEVSVELNPTERGTRFSQLTEQSTDC